MRLLAASKPIRTASAFRPKTTTPIKASVLPGAPQRWFHVCSVSDMTRNDYPITREQLEAYVAAFYEGPEAGPVYLGHLDAERRPSDPEPPAAAWVLALELTNRGELWALYEMPPTLLSQIKSGGYRYNSICGRFQSDDEGRVTGAEFYSIAITNKPAVVGLTPMAASRRIAKEGRLMALSLKDVLKEAQKDLPDDASREQIVQYIDAAIAKLEAIEGAGGAGGEPAESAAESAQPEPVAASAEPAGAPAPKPPAPAPEQVELAEDPAAMATAALTAVAEAAGVDLASVIASMQEDPAAFAALVTGETPESADAPPTPDEQAFSDDVKAAAVSRVHALSKQLSSERAEVKALSKRLAELEASGREREVDDAIAKGLFTDSERDRLVRLARNAPREWSFWLESAKESPAVPTGRVVQASAPRGAGFDAIAKGDPTYATYEATLSAVIKDPAKRDEIIRERLAARDRG